MYRVTGRDNLVPFLDLRIPTDTGWAYARQILDIAWDGVLLEGAVRLARQEWPKAERRLILPLTQLVHLSTFDWKRDRDGGSGITGEAIGGEPSPEIASSAARMFLLDVDHRAADGGAATAALLDGDVLGPLAARDSYASERVANPLQALV